MKIKLTNSEIELSDEDIKTLQEALKQPANKLKLEDHNFRVNSDGWKKITVDDKEYLLNEKEDIWEILHGEFRGEQLFTWDAAIRETKKAKKRMPTDEEWNLFEKENIKNIKYVGFRYTDGTFRNSGSYTYLWSSLQSSSSAWDRNLGSSEARVGRNLNSKLNGFSVRCIQE